MSYRLADSAWVAALLVAAAPLHAAGERTLTVVENGAPRRMPIDAGQLKLKGRAEGSSLICVQFAKDGVLQTKWAMPEFWMTDAPTVDVPRPTVVAQATSGANGLGNLRELKMMKQDECT